MSHVGAVGVSVLIYQPFPFGGICMACANVFGLQMLQLTVDVVAVSHLQLQIRLYLNGKIKTLGHLKLF